VELVITKNKFDKTNKMTGKNKTNQEGKDRSVVVSTPDYTIAMQISYRSVDGFVPFDLGEVVKGVLFKVAESQALSSEEFRQRNRLVSLDKIKGVQAFRAGLAFTNGDNYKGKKKGLYQVEVKSH